MKLVTIIIQTPDDTTPIFTWNEELIKCLDDEVLVKVSLLISLSSSHENNYFSCSILKGALEQKRRLTSLFPDLTIHSGHRVTKIALNKVSAEHIELLPTPLEWAFAMIRSR